jgi:hypothetical protein
VAVEEAPQRTDAEAMAALGELRLKLLERDVASLFDERQDQAFDARRRRRACGAASWG